MSLSCLLKVEENKAMPKPKNDYAGHIQTAITQKIVG